MCIPNATSTNDENNGFFNVTFLNALKNGLNFNVILWHMQCATKNTLCKVKFLGSCSTISVKILRKTDNNTKKYSYESRAFSPKKSPFWRCRISVSLKVFEVVFVTLTLTSQKHVKSQCAVLNYITTPTFITWLRRNKGM